MKKAICIIMAVALLSACGAKEKTDSSSKRSESTTTTVTTTKSPTTTTKTTTTTTVTTTETTTTATKKPKKTNFAIGETWTVKDQWKLTVTGVQLTEYRNPYSDKSPAAVYVVSCEYENIGYTDSDGVMSGLFFTLDAHIVDHEGYMGYSYPGEVTDIPQETPIGAKCKAQYCIGVDNAGDFKLSVEQHDGKRKKQTATFEISTKGIATITTTTIAEPEPEPVETQPDPVYTDPETETMPPETSPPETGTDMPDTTPTETEPDPAPEYDDSWEF